LKTYTLRSMKKFTLFNLLPEELAVVARRVLNFISVFVQNDASLKAAYDLLINNLNELKKSMSKDKKSRYTIKLLEKDAERDNAFICFRDFIKAFRKSNDNLKKEAAKLLLNIIQKYGFTLYKLPVVQQSDVMNRMMSELKQAKNLEAIKILGAAEQLEIMDVATTEYESLRHEKVDVETQQEFLHVRTAFRELGADLKDLIKFLALLKKANYNPELLPNIISSIEKEITDAMATARSRETRKENRKQAV
jgi:hypothetical protein